MKTIYIKRGLITYAVKDRIIDTNSNYNKGISIHMVGEKFPIWGTVIKESENTRKFANEVIDTWVKRVE